MLVYLTSFTFFLEILKKKSSENEKKSSENGQLTGHFQSFFIYFFSSSKFIMDFWTHKFWQIHKLFQTSSVFWLEMDENYW